MEYFCYVSRNKVDQLYEQVDPDAGAEITETRSTETDFTADAKIGWGVPHIISLFRIGGTYGRKGVIQREAKLKRTYIQKLETVLVALAAQAPIPPLSELVDAKSEVLSSAYYHFEGTLQVDTPVGDPRVDTVISLRSSVAGRPLLLDCSLRNFSEGPMPDGTFMLNSSNARFFEGNFPLPMKTVLLILGVGDERVIGSPLFLKLALTGSDLMLAL